MLLSSARLVVRGLRRRRPINGGLRILAYHGVVERYRDSRVEESFHVLADFRAHIAALKKLRVVGLEEIDDARRARLPRIAITFDDGFANNLLAAELLAEAKLPASFFVATGNVDVGTPIWPTLLRLVLARGSARRLEIAGTRYDLDGDPQAFATVRTLFKRMPRDERGVRWSELVAQLRSGELAALETEFPAIRMMTWRDVESLAAAGFTIGSHGSMHELHHAAQPRDVRHEELATSKSAIERALGRTCDAFAFPNGTHHDDSASEVRAVGYTRAFTMKSRAATTDDDLLLLPRLVPSGGADQLVAKLVFGN